MAYQNDLSGRSPISAIRNPAIRDHRVLVSLAVACASILAGLFAVKPFVASINRIVSWHPELVMPLFAAGFIGACLFAWIRYPERAPHVRIVLVGISVLLGLNNLWLGYDFPVAFPDIHDGVRPFLDVANIMVVAAMILSVFRPSFAILTSAVLVFQKQLAISMGGGFTGSNHYIVLVDLAVFMVVALLLFESARAVWRRLSPDGGDGLLSAPAFSEGFWLTVMCIALGAHLGNYFLSGFGKVMLDGGLMSWLFENKTHYLMLGGYNLGAAPLSMYDPAFGLAYRIVEAGYVPFNIVVLIAQVFCFVSFASKRLMMGTVVFFDLMHISIFVLTGALFFHWIVLNSVLLFAVKRMPSNLAPRFALLAGVLITITGHMFFHTVKLAWYDTNLVRDGRFVAVYADGSEADVPPSFFRESSYMPYNRGLRLPLNENRRDAVLQENADLMELVEPQAQTFGWGQTLSSQAMRASETCEVPADGTDPRADFDAESARTQIIARHEWSMDRLASGGALNYHIFPHDHFSLPRHFRTFETSDIRDIVGYYYKVETVCLNWVDGALQRDVITRSRTRTFDVRDLEGGTGS